MLSYVSLTLAREPVMAARASSYACWNLRAVDSDIVNRSKQLEGCLCAARSWLYRSGLYLSMSSSHFLRRDTPYDWR